MTVHTSELLRIKSKHTSSLLRIVPDREALYTLADHHYLYKKGPIYRLSYTLLIVFYDLGLPWQLFPQLIPLQVLNEILLFVFNKTCPPVLPTLQIFPSPKYLLLIQETFLLILSSHDSSLLFPTNTLLKM